MTRCDALIVGGGPAGAACAGRLRSGGLDVLVLDRKNFPRDKTCAGWITPQVIDVLDIDVDDYRRGRTLEPLTAISVAIIGSPEMLVRYDHPVSYGIRRCEFDHYRLEKSGARLCLGESLTDVKRVDGRWCVNGHIETPLLIGAGGHFLPGCPAPGPLAPAKCELAIAAQEIEFAMTDAQMAACPIESGIAFLYFCADLKGYGWYYRKGRHLNVGLGREDKDHVSDHVARFCSFLKEKGKIPADTTGKLLGHAYLLYSHSNRKMVDDDAPSHRRCGRGPAYARSGEGIRPAIESGLMAADTIISCAGATTTESLRPYETKLIARFGRKATHSVADWLPFGLQRTLARKLLTSAWLAGTWWWIGGS